MNSRRDTEVVMGVWLFSSAVPKYFGVRYLRFTGKMKGFQNCGPPLARK
jgi:hypothetical protein